jgi:transcriptional regulator with XRE-family HTH domain
MTYYNCPVCGYDELTKPPKNSYICPCCGTEFESDDFDKTPRELRREWIEKGMPWFSRSTLQPKDWNSFRQLIVANYGSDLTAHPRFKNDVNYRYAVNKAFSEVRIGKQLKVLRELEALTQLQVAQRADMKQSRISELEGMNYSSWSISTLERLAKALGVGFKYSFVRWSELVAEIENGLSQQTLGLPSFEHDHMLAGRVGNDELAALYRSGRPAKLQHATIPPLLSAAYAAAAGISSIASYNPSEEEESEAPEPEPVTSLNEYRSNRRQKIKKNISKPFSLAASGGQR